MDPFLGEIRLTAISYAPRGWAFCQGQTMSITQNTALYSLLGTQYGGDGRSNFMLPNLQARIPLHTGSGAGLQTYPQGQQGGTSTVTLTTTQLAAHTHTLPANTAQGKVSSPGTSVILAGGGGRGQGEPFYLQTLINAVNMNNSGPAGTNGPHNNMSPYLALNYIIALQGIFPPRP